MAAAAFATCEAQPWEAQEKCYGMLLKVMQNVVQNPGQAKFRSIKESSSAMQTKVLACPGGEALLLAAGFVKDGENYVLSGQASEQACAETLKALEAHANKAKGNELRRARDEQIAQTKSECCQKNNLKSEASEKVMNNDEMKAQLERDRKELEAKRNHEPVKSSKANITQFGVRGVGTVQNDSCGPGG